MADLREGLGTPAPETARTGFLPVDHAGDPFPPQPPGFTPLHDSMPPVSDEPTTQSVQGEVEGAPVLDDSNSIEFMGDRFRLAENVSLIPLMRFANASKKGLDSDDMAGLAAMYSLIRGIIHRPLLREPEKIQNGEGAWIVNPHAGEPQRDEGGRVLCDETEWDRFQDFAESMGADGEELMELVGKAMGVIAARPRQRRAVSSTPSPTTSQSSRGSSSLPATIPGAGELTDVRDLGR